MTSESIVFAIKAFLAKEIPELPDPLDSSMDLFAAGVIDSLLILMLVAFLEDTFEVELDHEDLTEDNFRSMDSMAGMIKNKNVLAA